MKKLAIATVLALSSAIVFADEAVKENTEAVGAEPVASVSWTPIEINLASPLSLPWWCENVYGLRLNLIYGKSTDIKGLDLGICGVNRGVFAGLRAGAFNYTDGRAYGVGIGGLADYCSKGFFGLQISGLVNWDCLDSVGAQIALLNFADTYTGVQLGFLNWNSSLAEGLNVGFANAAQSDFNGAMFGAVNYCKANYCGAQIGLFNEIAGSSEGLQLGLFNAADDHNGVQIGLLNLNMSAPLKIMCLVNANFR